MIIYPLWIFMLLFSTLLPAQEVRHALFTDILQEYVQQGRVNYADLCEDNRLETYLTQLANTDPDTLPNSNDQLAFWINAYNAYTLKVICDNYPLNSINDLHWGGLVIGVVLNKTIWDKELAVINGHKISLNHIEHQIIRSRESDPDSQFDYVCVDAPCPEAHFALVCASKSCPALRSEAYEGYKLEEQLEDQARRFFNDPERNVFLPGEKVARLNKILDWYEDDFGERDREVLLFVARYLPEDLAASIRARPEEWDIKYLDYDWSLNE